MEVSVKTEVASGSASLTSVPNNTAAALLSPEPRQQTLPPASPIEEIECGSPPVITLVSAGQSSSSPATLIIQATSDTSSASVLTLTSMTEVASCAASDMIAAAAAAAITSSPALTPPSTSASIPIPSLTTASETSPASEPPKKRFFRDVAKSCMAEENEYFVCSIDGGSSCSYKQLRAKYDAGNFIRHLRFEHPEIAKERGLFKKEENVPPTKKRKISKISVAIDKQIVWSAIMKLITSHNLPLQAVEWEGFKLIFDPICHALGISINRKNTVENLKKSAAMLKSLMQKEMEGKLISVQIDSASRHGRHILGVNVNFFDDDKVVIRVLGMIEVKQRQTAKFLKEKILELLQSYGVSITQLLAVTCDNGANMVAAVKQLQKQYVADHPSLEAYDDDSDDDDEARERLIEDLMEELQKSVSLIRCAVHTMQLAVTDIVKATDVTIKEITTIAKNTRKIGYKAMFEYNKISVPPFYSRTRWNGVYKMLNYFKQHEEFYKDIGRQYPELDLTNHWNYIDEYVSAFEPVFVCTNKMQAKHVSLSDFYVHWLNTVMQVGLLTNSNLAKSLVLSLTERLKPLKNNMAFKAALLVDPRFNYLNSKTLSPEDKEQTRSFMLATWERIKQLDPNSSKEHQDTAQQSKPTNSFDTFLTRLFGGLPPESDQNTKPLIQQLNALDLEDHQSFSFDVWSHWKNRLKTYPELSKLALVFLSVPSNQVNVERSFSGMALTLTERRTNLSEESLENILLIKLNVDLIDKIIPENGFQ